jgi:hypothetical protein
LFRLALSVTRSKNGAHLRASHIGDALVQLLICGTSFVGLCTHPPRFPIPAIARDVFRPDRVFAKHVAHGSSADLSQTTLSPLSTLLHISPPGEKRRWGRTVAQSTKPSTLSSTQAGRSVGATSSLGDDCECGRVVRVHPPVVLRGGLAYEADTQGRAT